MVNPRIKGAIGEFYSSVLLDKFPLRRLSNLDINCFEYEEIAKLRLQNFPIFWINQDLPNLGLEQGRIDKVNSALDRMRQSAFDAGPPQDARGRLDAGRELYVMSYLLDYQISTMTVLNDALDLGFLSMDLIKKVFALAGSLLNEKSEACTSEEEKALERFLKAVQQQDTLMPRFKLLVSQAVRTLRVVGKLRENLQMFILLKLFSNFETSSKEIKPRIEKVFKILSLSREKEDALPAGAAAQPPRPGPPQAQADALRKEFRQQKDLQFFAAVDQEISGFMQGLCQIDLILLDFVFNISKQEMKDYSNSKYHNKRQQEDVEYVGGQIDISKLDQQIRVAVLDVLTKYYNQRHHLLEKLIGVELIYGEEEKELYHQLTDHRKVENSLSVEVVKASVYKLLTLDPRWKASQAAPGFLQEYEAHIARITAPVTRIHEMLVQKYEQKMDFRKLQNLLKNEGYHTQLLRLFSIQYQDANQTAQKKLFKTLVDFFYQFCVYNTVNKKLLLPQLTTFIDLIAYGIDTSSLVATICQALEDSRAIGRTVDYVFKQIGQVVSIDSFVGLLNLRNSRKNSSKPTAQLEAVSTHLVNMIRYKKILSGMIFDEHNFRREDTQRKIIFCLINCKELVKIYEFKFFNEIKAMISKDGNKSEDAMRFYQFYAAYLSLLGELSWEFRMGIDQARRLVTKEQIMEILTSKATPIYFKKHFLKCFHHVAPPHLDLPAQRQQEVLLEDRRQAHRRHPQSGHQAGPRGLLPHQRQDPPPRRAARRDHGRGRPAQKLAAPAQAAALRKKQAPRQPQAARHQAPRQPQAPRSQPEPRRALHRRAQRVPGLPHEPARDRQPQVRHPLLHALHPQELLQAGNQERKLQVHQHQDGDQRLPTQNGRGVHR